MTRVTIDLLLYSDIALSSSVYYTPMYISM